MKSAFVAVACSVTVLVEVTVVKASTLQFISIGKSCVRHELLTLTVRVEVTVATPAVIVVVVDGVGILRHLHAEEIAVAIVYALKHAGFATARLVKAGWQVGWK